MKTLTLWRFEYKDGEPIWVNPRQITQVSPKDGKIIIATADGRIIETNESPEVFHDRLNAQKDE